MRSIQRQRGLSVLGLLFTLLFFSAIFFLSIKLMPAYIDQLTVDSALTALEKEPNVSTMTAGEVTSRIMRQMELNVIKDVQADDIYITQEGMKRIIEVDYEVQRKLIYNIDLLIRFNNRIEVPIR